MHRLTILGPVLAILLVGFVVEADDTHSVGGLTVAQPWARASAGPARTAAAYLTIRNGSGADDRLVAVGAGSVAATATLHSHLMEGNVMKMRPVDGIAVKAGETVSLAPGGNHVMLMGLKAPLKEGGRFPLTLTFEKAGAVTVEVAVEAVGATGAGPGKHRH